MNKLCVENRQQGMTLIEIMIALSLGALLLAGVIQVFLSSNQSYRMQDNLSRLQENGRFAVDFISRDLRIAGYFGCFSRNYDGSNVENELNDATNNAWDITTPIMGYDNVADTFAIFDDVVATTDVIVIRGLAGDSQPLINPYSNSAQVFVDDAFNDDCAGATAATCHMGEILMITDCTQATLFQTTQTSDIGGGSGVNVVHSGNNTFTPGNSSPTFSRSYGQGAELSKLRTFGYFIRLNDANEPSLFRTSISLTNNDTNALSADELVEGIEDMQILYGVDTDSDNTPNYYVSAGSVDFSNDQVVSVRITLIARTLDDNLTTTGDGRLRHFFGSTIAVRNRIP